MIKELTVRKNTLEIHSGFDEYNLPTIIHRNCIAYINYEKAGDLGYRLWFNYHNPIHNETGFMIYCADYKLFIDWFDYDKPSFPDPSPLGETLVDLLYATPTPESETQHISPLIDDTCRCCKEQMFSTSQRPEFHYELLCNTCYKAKIALASLEKETK